VKTCTR